MKKYILLFFFCVTIVCFAQETPPGVVISHLPANGGKYVGSPSICILPNGDYVASHDEFGPASNEWRSAVTRIFHSSDKGVSWKEISVINGLFWSNLFVHNNALYNIGTNKHHGNLVIRRSTDGGKTWTNPYNGKNGLLLEGEYHTSSMPMMIHNGRIWRAVEYATAPTTDWGKRYSAMVISAPVNADLLDAKNWRKTNHLMYDPTYLDGKFGAWLEGNVVVNPEGKMLNILRVGVPAGVDEYAAMVEISKDGKKASFNPATGFVHFPGGAKKFMIRYDPQSKLYWTIHSTVASQFKELNPSQVRNTLVLSSSTDLRDWQTHEILLSHPDQVYHGFQYVDWQFEGDDIIFASRTAFDDETGGAVNNHDANYLTFHRIKDFKNLTKQKELAFLFKSGDDGYHTFRIPAMAVTNKGTVLAFCEGRKNSSSDTGDVDMVLKRSTDGGTTWSEIRVVWDDGENTCGNPAPVVDRETGAIFLLMTKNLGIDRERQIIEQTSKDTRRIFVTQSTDDGVTWTVPVEITKDVKQDNWTWYATGPCHGIQIEHGKYKGRLVIPCDHIEAETKKYFSHVIYSDDHGKTWKLGGTTPVDQVNECTVAEIADGKLLLNMRNYDRTQKNRKTAVSSDGGITWTDFKSDEVLIEPICQAAMHRYSFEQEGKSRLLFTNPANTDKRCNMTLRLSYDDGTSWAKSMVLFSGPAAYSEVARLPDGDIGCFYEAGYEHPYEGIVFEKIKLVDLEK